MNTTENDVARWLDKADDLLQKQYGRAAGDGRSHEAALIALLFAMAEIKEHLSDDKETSRSDPWA